MITAGGVSPIISLDAEPIGDRTPGPLPVRLRDGSWGLVDEPSDLTEAIDLLIGPLGAGPRRGAFMNADNWLEPLVVRTNCDIRVKIDSHNT